MDEETQSAIDLQAKQVAQVRTAAHVAVGVSFVALLLVLLGDRKGNGFKAAFGDQKGNG